MDTKTRRVPSGDQDGFEVLVVATRQLRGVGRAVGRTDEHVTSSVAGPALVVELELQPGEPTRAAALLVLLLVLPIGDARDEREPTRVGRPDRVSHVLGKVGETLRLPALERKDEKLLLVGVPVGGERQASAVGRETRPRVGLDSRSELSRPLRAVRGDDPDRAAVLALLTVDARHDEGNRLSVRGQARVRDRDQLVDIFGNHSGHHASSRLRAESRTVSPGLA